MKGDKGWIGAIIAVLLLAYTVGAMRRDESTSSAPNPTTFTPVATAAPAPVTAPPLVVATAAPVLPAFDWSRLKGVVVDHDIAADGRFVLQVANRGDDSVVTFAVPEAIWRACAIPSEFDGSRPTPCWVPG